MKKKSFGILLVMCIMFMFVSLTAFADTDPKLIVDGVNLMTVPSHQITCSGGGTASYDPSSKTLTLNNATITNYSPGTINAGLYIDEFGGPFTVKLIGENKIHFDNKYLGIVSWNASGLNIVPGSTGDDITDSLDIFGYAKKNTTESPFGIQNRKGDISIGKIKLSMSLKDNSRSNGCAIETSLGAVTLNGTILNVEDYNGNVWAETSINCIDSNITSTSADEFIRVENGSAEFNNCKITVNGTNDYESFYTFGDLSFINSDVTIHSLYSNAVCCDGKFTVSGGKLNATADDYYPAIFAGNGMLVQNDAEIIATAPNSNAINAMQFLTVESGKISANSDNNFFPIFVKKLDFSAPDSKPTDDSELIDLGNNIMAIGGIDVLTSDWEYDSAENYWYRDSYFNTTLMSLNIDTAYVISFEPGANGTGSASSAIKNKNTDLILPDAIFTREGYTQIGWASAENATTAEYDLGATYISNASATLYPVWKDMHTNLKHIDYLAPTTENEGNIEYWICKECGKLFSDSNAANEISLADTVISKLTASGEKSPKTGDFLSKISLVVLLVSGSMLAALWLCEKKKKAE